MFDGLQSSEVSSRLVIHSVALYDSLIQSNQNTALEGDEEIMTKRLTSISAKSERIHLLLVFEFF